MAADSHPIRTIDEFEMAIRQQQAFRQIDRLAVLAETLASVVKTVTETVIQASRLNLNSEPSLITGETQLRSTIAISTPGHLGVDRMVTATGNFTLPGIYSAFRESHGRAAL